jgi:hypothetical protein
MYIINFYHNQFAARSCFRNKPHFDKELMMKIMKSLLIAASFAIVATPAVASTSPLIGTWILEKSENPMPDGTLVPYCTGVHGLIIYTEEGYVSVALNCDAVGHGTEPADISGRKFFYAGTFTFDGHLAKHKMINASQPELIGSEFTRQVTIVGNELILTGVNQGQQFSAYWKKVTANP